MQAMNTSPAPSRPIGPASTPTPITGTEMPAYATTNSVEITAARRSAGRRLGHRGQRPAKRQPLPGPADERAQHHQHQQVPSQRAREQRQPGEEPGAAQRQRSPHADPADGQLPGGRGEEGKCDDQPAHGVVVHVQGLRRGTPG